MGSSNGMYTAAVFTLSILNLFYGGMYGKSKI